MTLLRPVTREDIMLRERISTTARKARLNLSETIALNKEFGLDLKYIPNVADIIEITHYVNSQNPVAKKSRFSNECRDIANEFLKEKGTTITYTVKQSKKSDFKSNLDSALSKMKKALLKTPLYKPAGKTSFNKYNQRITDNVSK